LVLYPSWKINRSSPRGTPGPLSDTVAVITVGSSMISTTTCLGVGVLASAAKALSMRLPTIVVSAWMRSGASPSQVSGAMTSSIPRSLASAALPSNSPTIWGAPMWVRSVLSNSAAVPRISVT
jgi:hypothetical protein